MAALAAAVKRPRPVIQAELDPMTDDVETRRRRAAYRACHRGTKEMDWMLGRFAEARSSAMSPTPRHFERLLALPDPDLQDMILHPELAAGRRVAEHECGVRAFTGGAGVVRAIPLPMPLGMGRGLGDGSQLP